MKDLIRGELAKEPRPEFKRLILGEFLQHLVLQSLYRQGAFKNLVFTGGTALRILYHTGRYSEDLDFSLVKPRGFHFRLLLEKIQKDLGMQQLPFDFYLKEEKIVAKADLRFPGLLGEFRISPIPTHKLTVKLEVDKRPPAGGEAQVALVASPVSYTVAVFDLPSLFATKLHALFFRRYAKGRDYYDLVWFLGRNVKPNLGLLNRAIRQTQGPGHEIRKDEWERKLIGRLESADFGKIRSEVERFILDREELKFLGLESIKSLLRNY